MSLTIFNFLLQRREQPQAAGEDSSHHRPSSAYRRKLGERNCLTHESTSEVTSRNLRVEFFRLQARVASSLVDHRLPGFNIDINLVFFGFQMRCLSDEKKPLRPSVETMITMTQLRRTNRP